MVRIGARPGPTTELCTPVVVEGLHDLRPGVHDERSMLSDRLTDGATLEQHELGQQCQGAAALLARLEGDWSVGALHNEPKQRGQKR